MLSSRHLHRLAVAGAFVCAFAPHAHADGFSAVQRAAKHEGVPVRLALAVAEQESSGSCHASSGVAFGVMQVKRETAKSVGVRGNLYDCHTGALAGVRYLKQALIAARGNWAHAATLFNRGIYARPVMTRYASLVMSRVR